MKRLAETNLYIGGIADLEGIDTQEFAFVHATQTIHYQIFGWDRKFNKPDKNHPNYIYHEKDNRISLNWVDGEARLYNWSGIERFINILNFIDRWIPDKKVFIHCDQGQSRAPTLGLLYLSKRAKLISDQSFDLAKNDFIKMYPSYSPGGIGDFVRSKWNEIN